MPTRFQIAKKDILSLLDGSERHVFSFKELAEILKKNRSGWRLPQTMTVRAFIGELAKPRLLHMIEIVFDQRTEVRYVWRQASPYAIGLSLGKTAYLCYFTALAIHDLTRESPKTIYLNIEQSPKPPARGKLEQTAINRAFADKQRRSELLGNFGDSRYCIVSGKSTGQLGVQPILWAPGKDTASETLRVTGIERTLIDIAVRPGYAGGPNVVLEAYRRAADLVNVNQLRATLHQLNYTYPYHQAIGFYLERSGKYSNTLLRIFEEMPREFDFFLDYGMRSTRFDSKWRVHFPAGMDLEGE